MVIGNRQLHSHLGEIRQLRRRCGQEDDLTTEPEYFIAANALANRRCAAVLIRQDNELEACVLFYEHCRFGMGLGLFRGGDYIGESLVAGPGSIPRALCAFSDPGTTATVACSWREPHHQGCRRMLHWGHGSGEPLQAILRNRDTAQAAAGLHLRRHAGQHGATHPPQPGRQAPTTGEEHERRNLSLRSNRNKPWR